MRPFNATAIFALSLILICAYGGVAQAQGTKSGKPRGVATFYGMGKVTEYAPDVAVWTGTFPGQSVTDAGKGVLHFAAWDCTGEIVYRSGKVAWGGGFCSASDNDGDQINLRWEVDEQDANPAKLKTKGTTCPEAESTRASRAVTTSYANRSARPATTFAGSWVGSIRYLEAVC